MCSTCERSRYSPRVSSRNSPGPQPRAGIRLACVNLPGWSYRYVGPPAAGVLRLAPRQSEHVVCAGGGPVLGAGEMSFREESGQWVVAEVSNQSTGFCPDISSWSAVAKALDSAGIEHPSGFTHEVVFRRCPSCSQLNIVREEDFICVFCDEDLPREWNVDGSGS